jgi:tetratricopeptide (TPR) repeat protein
MKKINLIVFSITLFSCNNDSSVKDFLEKDRNETDIVKSIQYCTKAIEIDSASVEAYYQRAALYTSLANGLKTMIEDGMQDKGTDIVNYQNAIRDYIKILSINPNDEKAQANIGFNYLYMGDTATACLELNKASEMGDDGATKKLKKICSPARADL